MLGSKFSLARTFNFTKDLTRKIGVDFVINSKDTYKIASDSVLDAVWAASSGYLGLWLMQSKDSVFVVRQGVSAAYHAIRFGSATAMSLADVGFCQFISKFVNNSETLSINSASVRAIRRMMNMMRQNGGVYEELADLIRNFGNVARLAPSCILFTDALNDTDHIQKPHRKSAQIVMKLFERELKKPFFDVFSEISPEPTHTGSVISHRAVLKTGEPVSITVMKPTVERMRKLDMIPLRLIQGFINIIPTIELEKTMVNTFVERLNFSIRKEIRARETILGKYGIDLSEAPGEVLAHTRCSWLPLDVAPPLRNLCASHVMVTGEIGSRVSSLTSSDARKLCRSFANFAYKRSLIISDWSKKNLVRGPNGLSLFKFATCAEFDATKLTGMLRFASGVKPLVRSGGRLLNLDAQKVENMLREKKLDMSLMKRAIAQNAQFLLGFAEASCGLVNANIEAKSHLTTMTPVLTGLCAKIASPTASHDSLPLALLGWIPYV